MPVVASKARNALALVVILLVGGLPLTSFFVGTASAAATIYREDFNTPGMAGWTTTGVISAQDCTTALNGTGCSLNVSARLNGAETSASHDLAVAFGTVPNSASFYFRNEKVESNSRAWAILTFSGEGSARLNLTDGDPHRGVSLTVGSQTTTAFFNSTSKTWHKARIYIDGAQDIIRAEIRSASGTLLASSSNLTLPANATGISSITFGGSYSGQNPVTQPAIAMNFDEFVVDVATPPAAPGVSGIGGPGAGQVRLNWTTPSDDGGAPITNFTIYAGDSDSNLTYLTNVSAADRTYVDGTFGNGVWRYYRVSAWNAAGHGTNSTIIALRTFTTPSAPRNVTPLPGDNVGEIKISWQTPSDFGGQGASITAYSIYRGTAPTSLSNLANVSGLSYTDTHRQNGTVYYYAVSATNVAGEGSVSNTTNSTPRADRTWAPQSILLTPLAGWTGDSRTLDFRYQVAVSECELDATCPVSHEWSVFQDGTPNGADGTPLASGTNIHDGHAGTTTFDVSTTVTPIGTDGAHWIKVGVNTRAGSTPWNVSNISFQIDAPRPGELTGPAQPILNRSTAGGEYVQVASSYGVKQKQCRPTDTCPVQNEWLILLDGTTQNSPDGTVLAQGNHSHPAHGSLENYTINESVYIPPLGAGPHYVKVAARADASSPWRVSYTLTSGVIFQPNLDDASYTAAAGQGAFIVSNSGTDAVWRLAETPDLPIAGHTGSKVWGTTPVGNYPPLAVGTLRINDVSLAGATSASLSLKTWFETADNYDTAQVYVVDASGETLVEPSTGPGYSDLVDGARGWAGSSGSWVDTSFDLTPYAGETVDIELRFRSDAVAQARGWFVDDISILRDSTVVLRDDFESVWSKVGDWVLAQPTTGPGRGDGSLNAWSVAATAQYNPDSTSILHLPKLTLEGVPQAMLSFHHWMKSEYGSDRGRVEISADGGQTWTNIHPQGGLLYDRLPDGSYGWSGNTLGWKTSTFELTPYAGSPLNIRFVFETDDVIQNDGWYISDFAILAAPPSPTIPAQFDSYAGAADAFYAYFESAGTTASFTTPEGQTVSIRYTGSSGDAVAKLTADGTLTARKALVGITGPVSVPASEFIVTGAPFTEATTTGSWTLRGAPKLGGVGGTQLKIGGKVFDDVSPAAQPIEGTGLGSISASNRPVLQWNWHNTGTARYDTTLTSESTPDETPLDTRIRFYPDGDLDDFSDKAELRGFSDLALATSTPLADDDGDGIPNEIETSRDAAVDFFSTTVNDLVYGTLGGSNWEHAGATELVAYEKQGAPLRDFDSDGIPDFADITNDEGAGTWVGTDPTTNFLRLSTARAGFQVAILISPTWEDVVLVEVGAGGSDLPPTSITYDEFFQELSNYYGATELDDLAQVDDLLNLTLRQHLDDSMSYTLVRRTLAAGATTTIGLDFLAGIAADGTWTVIRDTDLPTLQLAIEGEVIDASFPAGAIPNIGVLHASWFFLNVHNKLRGFEDVSQCLTYNVLVRESACSSFPTMQGMRLYSPEATRAMRGLLTQLRTVYREASLMPEVYDAIKVVIEQNAPEPVNNAAWQGFAAADVESTGVSLVVPEGTLAIGDYGAAIQRTFNWNFVFRPASPTTLDEPSIDIGIEPADGSHEGGVVFISGAVLAALGADVSEMKVLRFDAEHMDGTTAEWRDADSDGYPDYLVTFEHFSKAWVFYVQINAPPWTGDFSVVSSTRAFMALGYPNTYVWAGACEDWAGRCAGGWNLINPMPDSILNGIIYAVDAAGPNEAWFVGGDDCSTSRSSYRGWALRLQYAPGNPHSSTWTPYILTERSTCQAFYDVDAFSSSDVWIVGADGQYIWNGAWWSLGPGPTNMNHIQRVDSANAYATWLNPNPMLLRFSPSSNVWSVVSMPFVTTNRPGSFNLNDGRTVLWATSNGQTAYCVHPCSGSWVSTTPGSFTGAVVYGHDTTEAWAAGSHSSAGSGALHRRGANGWVDQGNFWNFGGTNQFRALDFEGRNEAWMMDGNARLYHYTGSNSAPTASFTFTPTSPVTTDTASFDGSGSQDADFDPISYSWDWGDGTSGASGVSASHRFREPGTYTVTLTVTDSEGATGQTTRQVVVDYATLTNGQGTSSSFGASSQQDFYKFQVPSGKDRIDFTLSGDSGTDFNLYIRFEAKPSVSQNDGSSTGPGSTESIQRTPANAGWWNVMVRSNSGSGSYTVTATHRAKPSVPTIAQSPNPQTTSADVTLGGSSTAESPIFYTVNWGDGTPNSRYPSSGTVSSGSPYSLPHRYASTADYTVSVTTTDSAGLTNSGTGTVVIRNPPTVSTQPATNVGQTSATLVGSLDAFGGYSSAESWFEYGLTTSYGSTTPVVVRSTLGQFSAPVSGLQTNTDYHFRAKARNAMGEVSGIDRVFHTVDISPNTPTMQRSLPTTSTNQILWVNGSASDPEGDAIYFQVNWHDGTPITRYPTTGTVPSGSTYSVQHAYMVPGTYNVSVNATDTLGVASPYAVQFHDVVDMPTGTTTPASGIGRASATLHGNITSLGGDPAGVTANFQYGLQGGGYPFSTPVVRYTGAAALAIPITGLTEGATYQYRLVITNLRGTTETSPVTFTTNMRPSLSVLDMVPPTAYTDTKVSFVVRYSDVANEAPGSGYPRIIIDGVPFAMASSGQGTDFVSGVTYALNTVLSVGTHSYRYEWTDSLTDVQTIAGRTPSIRVYRQVSWADGINHDSSANGLPSPEWARTGTGAFGPTWQTVNTPAASGLADAPDWPNSVSLWFGDAGTGTYANASNAAARGSVLTPELDLTQVDSPALQFWTYFETQDNGTTRDTKKVYAVDAQNREILLATLAGPYQGDHKWWPVSISLKEWEGQLIRIRFEFDTVDGNANNFRGWFLNEMTVGTDRDDDDIPDASEDQLHAITTWTSIDSYGSAASGASLVGHQWGIQHSFTDTLVSAIAIKGSSCNTRVVLNTTTWSSTLIDGSCPATNGRGAGTTIQTNGPTFVLHTNLTQAGFPLRRLDTPENFTLTVTNSGGSSIKLLGFQLRAAGYMQSRLPDTDGDGLEDRREVNRLGTIPMSRDPDNDGYLDGLDIRPMTPDDPPYIDVLDPGSGTWLTKVRAHVTSRWGIQDVRLFYTGTGGSRELTNPYKADTETWEWTFPTDLGRVTKVRIAVNDTWRNNMEMTVEYSSTQVAVKNVKSDFKLFDENGVPIIIATAGTAVGVSAGATAIGTVLAPEVVLPAVVIGMLVVGVGTLAVDTYQKTNPSTVEVIQRDFRYPTSFLETYPISTGPLGCTNKIYLTQGLAGAYASRGAKGMLDSYHVSRTPTGYANINQVRDRLWTAVQNGGQFYQLDAHTGVLLWADPTLGIVDRWQIQLNPATCSGEFVSENRMKVKDTDIAKAMWLAFGASALYALMHAVPDVEDPDDQEDEPARVHFYDAKNNFAVAEEVEASISDKFGSVLVRKMCHMPPLVVFSATAPSYCPLESITEAEGSFSIQVAMDATAAGREQAKSNGTSFKPAWYWWNASRVDRGAAGSLFNAPLRDGGTGVYAFDDATQADAWNDLGAARSLNSLAQFQDEPSPQEMLRSSEQRICDWISTHPGSGSRYGFLPVAYTHSTPSHIYVELADATTKFGYGGSC